MDELGHDDSRSSLIDRLDLFLGHILSVALDDINGLDIGENKALLAAGAVSDIVHAEGDGHSVLGARPVNVVDRGRSVDALAVGEFADHGSVGVIAELLGLCVRGGSAEAVGGGDDIYLIIISLKAVISVVTY